LNIGWVGAPWRNERMPRASWCASEPHPAQRAAVPRLAAISRGTERAFNLVSLAPPRATTTIPDILDSARRPSAQPRGYCGICALVGGARRSEASSLS